MIYDAAANGRDGYDLAIRKIREARIQKSGLTKRQYECLSFIRLFISAKGYSPSYIEIRTKLGLKSNSGVARLCVSLKERGYITFLPSRSRSIMIVED